MRPAINRIGEALGLCGAVVLVAVSLPFIVLALIVLRATLVAAAATALVGALGLFCVHSPFRGWVRAHAGPTGHAKS